MYLGNVQPLHNARFDFFRPPSPLEIVYNDPFRPPLLPLHSKFEIPPSPPPPLPPPLPPDKLRHYITSLMDHYIGKKITFFPDDIHLLYLFYGRVAGLYQYSGFIAPETM